MAAINVVPRRDATRALSPIMTGLPVWVSCPDKKICWIAQDRENKGSAARKGEALRTLNVAFFAKKLRLANNFETISPFSTCYIALL